MSESVNFIPMGPAQLEHAERFAAELRVRLKERLPAARVEVQNRGVAVLVPVDSREEADSATRVVRDCVHGVNQTFAIDALDEGRRTGIVSESRIQSEFRE